MPAKTVKEKIQEIKADIAWLEDERDDIERQLDELEEQLEKLEEMPDAEIAEYEAAMVARRWQEYWLYQRYGTAIHTAQRILNRELSPSERAIIRRKVFQLTRSGDLGSPETIGIFFTLGLYK